jgi:hypothetical protein
VVRVLQSADEVADGAEPSPMGGVLVQQFLRASRGVVSPLLDDEAQRRFGGCLEDANLDRNRLVVTRTVLVPAEGSAGSAG